jgi:hypothetical protein
MSEEQEEKKNILDQLNDAVVNLAESIFGEQGKEFIEDTQEKVKDFSSQSIKKFLEFSDSVLESLKLDENEQVIKARDSVEDLLKQAGLLKDEYEEEEF